MSGRGGNAPVRTLRGGARAEAAAGVPVRPGAVWFGAAGGALAWAAHLGASYAAVPFVCGTTAEWLLHLLTLVLAAVAAAAVLASWRSHRRLSRWIREHPEGEGAVEEPALGEVPAVDHARRHNFLTIFGTFTSAFFLALILVEGIPALLAEPCRTIPTLDRPTVRGPAGPVLGPGAAAGPVLGPGAMGGPVLLAGGVPLGAGAAASAGSVHPADAWTTWNWDPWILGALLLLGVVYLRGVRALWRRAGVGRGLPAWRVVAYLGGLAAVFAALISPVEAVSEALFSVHMVQHLLLLVVAPPLLVVGRPDRAFLWSLPAEGRRRLGGWWRRAGWSRGSWRALTHPATVLALHVGALWLWHVPALYEAALERRWVHHLEHASFFFSAMLFWWVLALAGNRRRWPGYGAGVLYVTATALQGGALGALLTFAPEPWYSAHAPGAAAWGVDLMVDQQLAGTLMWVPAGLVYAGAAVFLFVAWLRETERTVARRERRWSLSSDERVRGELS